MLNLCGIVVAILKMATGRSFSMSGINSDLNLLSVAGLGDFIIVRLLSYLVLKAPVSVNKITTVETLIIYATTLYTNILQIPVFHQTI
jgi:hypothetical protein